MSALSIIKKCRYICYSPARKSIWEETVSEVLSTKDIVSSKTDQPRLVNNIFLHFFLENEAMPGKKPIAAVMGLVNSLKT